MECGGVRAIEPFHLPLPAKGEGYFIMRNIKLLIEYEGTRYAGWQVQSVLPTVQGEIIKAIKTLIAGHEGLEPIKLSGASRTDAGVHASGQVANFMTESRITPYAFQHGLNSILPSDIVIKKAEEEALDFDSRRLSKGKTYVYTVLNRAYPSALLRNFSWFVFTPLDVNAMKEATGYFLGEKDFSSFCAAHSDACHPVRNIASFEIHEKGDGVIEFEVKGEAFLRHMVRIMAGTIVAVGKGKIKPSDIKRIIEAKDRRAASTTAPGQGLCLMKVDY